MVNIMANDKEDKQKVSRLTTGPLPSNLVDNFNPHFLRYARNAQDIWRIDQHMSSVFNTVAYAKLNCKDEHNQIDSKEIKQVTNIEVDELRYPSRPRAKNSLLTKLLLSDTVERLERYLVSTYPDGNNPDEYPEAYRLYLAHFVINSGYSLEFLSLDMPEPYIAAYNKMSNYMMETRASKCQLKFIIELIKEYGMVKGHMNTARRYVDSLINSLKDY